MRNASHKTSIAYIRSVVEAVRKENGWSREAMAMEIVAAHERIGADVATGIVFEKSGDAFATAKKHADRIWLWLDDESKDNNLLPTNFMNSILTALPLEYRVSLLNTILANVDCVARGRHHDTVVRLDAREFMQCIVRINHRTEADAADLLDGIDPGELPRLHGSLAEDVREKQRMMRVVESAIHKSGEQKAELPKVA